VALRLEDSHRKERKLTKSGAVYYTYFFRCSRCSAEISSQHNYTTKHSGLCRSCTQKGHDYISAYTQLLNSSKARKIEVDLDYDDFLELCQEPNCHYCLKPLNRTVERGNAGYRAYLLDRKNNSFGYTKDNCVPCCWRCNRTKGNYFNYEEFVAIGKVVATFTDAST
jgi:hypothetical protein